MNKIAATVAFIAMAVSVRAQNSFTLYGRVDNGIQYESGLPRGSQISAQSGDFGESWFGIRGSEYLGSGTKAILHLESGLDTQNGSYLSGALFARAATVGLTNDAFGTFKLGNVGNYEVQSYSFYVDPQFMQHYSISTLVRGRNYTYAGSSLEYTSPTVDGLTVQGQYDLANSHPWNGNGGFGSGPGQLGGAQGRSDGIGAQFNASDFGLVAIYDEIRNPNGQFSNVYVSSRSILAGGNVTFGPVKIYLGGQHLSAPNASDTGYFGSATPTTLPVGTSLPTAVNHEWLGAMWQASPFVGLNAAVYHANANHGNGNATLYTFATQYILSKRTFLYSEVGYVRNSTTSNIGLGDGYTDPYGSNINNDPINGGTSTAPDFGHGQFGAFAGVVTQF